MREYRKLGDMLVAKGLLSSLQLSVALAAQRTSSQRLGEILVERGFIDEDAIANCLAEQYGYPLDDLTDIRPEHEALALIPADVALAHLLLPLKTSDTALECVICDPIDVNSTDVVERLTGRRLDLRLAPQSRLTDAIRMAYGLIEGGPEASAERAAGLPERFRRVSPRPSIGAVSLYDAWDTVLPRKVSLASIPSTGPLAGPIDAMVKAVARIRSPRVSTVYDAFSSDGLWWTVFEHLDGESLQHVLHTRGKRTPAQSAQLISEICEGVDALNRRGGISGMMVCPANVLVRSVGAVLVPFSTPEAEYNAPEVLAGEPTTLATDVYPLGVLLWQCLEGLRASPPAELEQGQTIADEADMPSGLRDILSRCLAANPADRFSSPLQLCQALRAHNWETFQPRVRQADGSPADRDALLDSITLRESQPSFWQRLFHRRQAA